MPARNTNSRPSGPSSPLMKFLPIVIILIGAGIAAYFFLSGGTNNPAPSAAQPGAPGAPGATAAGGAATAAPAPELTKEQLMKEASTAMHEQRYVAPQGNNALEYYLRVLDKEPNNSTARDALREMFPMVTPVAEQAINAGNLDEATRIIDMLAKTDPSNYTLTILRSKLEAKKKQVDREQQVAAAAAAAAKPAATTQGAAAQTQAAAPAEQAAAAPASATTASTQAPAQPAPPKPTPAPPPAATEPAAAPAGGETHAAELVKSAAPDYPRDAYRARTTGWVEVEFTVAADGSVSGATVVGAEPARIFNDAALNAVKRWTFKPRMENGKAVDERIRRRIEFKL